MAHKTVADLLGSNLGEYRLSGVLGSGGMAVVFRAADRAGTPVAVKALLPGATRDAASVELFRREAAAARDLEHPNLVRVLGSGEADGTLYCAMELVEGRTLDELLATTSRLGFDEAIHLMRGLCRGLAHLHDQGFVHRDVKPGNVFLRGAKPDVLLGDFGLLKPMEDEAEPDAAKIYGTPAYMSPEQFRGGALDHRSDVYQLGVVLYRLLVGSLPFEGEDLVTLGRQHVRAPPPPPRSRNPALPEDLSQVVLRCLAKDPAQRYDSAPALVLDLTRYMVRRQFDAAKDSSSAIPRPPKLVEHPPTLAERFWEWEEGFRKDLRLMVLGLLLGLAATAPLSQHLPVPVAFQTSLVLGLLLAYLGVRRRRRPGGVVSLMLGWASLLGTAILGGLVAGRPLPEVSANTTVAIAAGAAHLRLLWAGLRDAELGPGYRLVAMLACVLAVPVVPALAAPDGLAELLIEEGARLGTDPGALFRPGVAPLSFLRWVLLPVAALIHLRVAVRALGQEEPGVAVQRSCEALLAGAVGVALGRALT